MAKKKQTKNKTTFSRAIGIDYIINDKTNFVYGLILIAVAIYITIAFVSYFNTAQADQSLVTALRPGEIENTGRQFQNICGSLGAIISHFLIARSFGLPAFLIPLFVVLCGLKLMGVYRVNLIKWFFGTSLVMVWSSITLAKFLTPLMSNHVFNPGGDHGAFVCQWFENIIGAPGLIALLLIVALAFLTYLTSETIIVIRKMLNPVSYITKKVKFTIATPATDDGSSCQNVETAADPTVFDNPEEQVVDFKIENTPATDNIAAAASPKKAAKNDAAAQGESEFSIEAPKEEEKAKGNDVSGKDKILTPINPLEPWTRYKFPTLDLLKQYPSDSSNYIDPQEQERNKNRIIEVLHNFGVEISSIRATVGPTITLYEITPAPGVKISRIKNLEDDIALSLAALGIRIIAPMPGKGTIGIEVPNEKSNIVSMHSILNSKKFQESRFELPIALGKTITNDVFMVDLAKIPHLLVAGATGQGKSVGMNAIITSLLYKKHPNTLKFVLVDPKKVEFSVYAPIANHFMAANEENEEEPIITDVQKVVKTLKGLCVMMDTRYDLLKKAGARNIKEYNQKFLNHRLNPEDGHDFMPYIVIIIDEFADLIITAGKEIETPITRIAQLARAVGMHMVIATQRPSTKVITGGIKANFPGRIAFKVSSRIDSSIILDRTGAHQLIGRGDMLYSNGSEPVRVQCAFVDTPEVESINEFISSQPGPLHPLDIPEPLSEDGGAAGQSGLDAGSLDPLFKDAAQHIVATQQGSTSMIQRKFSIGYNRAGRLMDQLEKAGVVGAAQGSKPREVLITDPVSLDNLLASLA